MFKCTQKNQQNLTECQQNEPISEALCKWADVCSIAQQNEWPETLIWYHDGQILIGNSIYVVFFKLWNEWISVWMQAWLLVILYAFHHQHRVSLIFKWESYFSILAIGLHIFCGARDIWNNMRTVVCSIGFHIRKFKLRIWLKFSANSTFK